MMTLWKPSVSNLGSDLASFESTFDQILGAFGQSSATPAMDVVDSADAITVRMDLPGFEAKDIQVKLENDVLTVLAERESAKQDDGAAYLVVERSFGRMTRSLVLPSTVDADKVEARYKGGVLTISLPKREEARPRTIEVKVQE